MRLIVVTATVKQSLINSVSCQPGLALAPVPYIQPNRGQRQDRLDKRRQPPVSWFESSRRALAPGSRKIINRGYRQARLDKSNQINRGYRQARLDKPTQSYQSPSQISAISCCTCSESISSIFLFFRMHPAARLAIEKYQEIAAGGNSWIANRMKQLASVRFSTSQM